MVTATAAGLRRGEYELEVFAHDLLALLEQLDQETDHRGALRLEASPLCVPKPLSEHSVAKALVLVDTTPRMEAAGVTRILRWMLDGLEGFASLEEAA